MNRRARILWFALALSFFGAMAWKGASQSQWQVLNYWPGYWWSEAWPSNNDVATFSFPHSVGGDGVAYPAFLVYTNATPISLSGCTLSATFTVEADPNTVFRFGGQGNWNTGSAPPNTRFFFSTKTGYSNVDPCPECSWWSDMTWVEIGTNTGTATISDPLNPLHWSDSNGQTDTNLFQAALTNVVQWGLAYGGGSFFDVGIAVVTEEGNATFHLQDFEIIAPPTPIGLPDGKPPRKGTPPIDQ